MAKINWINKKDKKNYLNICKYNGVRFSFESGIPEKTKNELSKLINYLRKERNHLLNQDLNMKNLE